VKRADRILTVGLVFRSCRRYSPKSDTRTNTQTCTARATRAELPGPTVWLAGGASARQRDRAQRTHVYPRQEGA